MAFLKDTDGKGYVQAQELKLPWKLITLSRQFHAGATRSTVA